MIPWSFKNWIHFLYEKNKCDRYSCIFDLLFTQIALKSSLNIKLSVFKHWISLNKKALAVNLLTSSHLHNVIATCCNSFWDTLITSFQCQKLQRARTQKNRISFSNFHKVIYSLSSISWPSLKLLAVTVFEISWLQVFNAKVCKGQ